MTRRSLAVLAAVTVLVAAGGGEVVSQAGQKPAVTGTDWPQWRGPTRDGVVGAALPARWPETLKKRWETPVGTGHASPVVSGNRVVVIARGRIVGEGTPAELGARLGRERLEDVFLELVRPAADRGPAT